MCVLGIQSDFSEQHDILNFLHIAQIISCMGLQLAHKPGMSMMDSAVLHSLRATKSEFTLYCVQVLTPSNTAEDVVFGGITPLHKELFSKSHISNTYS